MRRLWTVCLPIAWLAAWPVCGADPPEGTDPIEIERLRTTLLQEEEADPYGLKVPASDPRLQAIKRLTELGSSEAVSVLERFLTTYGANRHLKQHALVALGRIGSEEAVNAVREFEEWAEEGRQARRHFRFGAKDSAIDHFAQHYLEPLAMCQNESGERWAVFGWHRLGMWDLWLTKAGWRGRWSDPILLDVPGLQWRETRGRIELAMDDGQFVLRVGDRLVRLDVERLVRDTDGDGVRDLLESRLRTDPAEPDTDGDGAPDGNDGNPLTPKHTTAGDSEEIRQAVFSVLYATSNSQDSIGMVGDDDFAQQEYYGYGGYVLKRPKLGHNGVNSAIWRMKVEILSPTEAVVTIHELLASYGARLKKMHGRWVVVDFRRTEIS